MSWLHRDKAARPSKEDEALASAAATRSSFSSPPLPADGHLRRGSSGAGVGDAGAARGDLSTAHIDLAAAAAASTPGAAASLSAAAASPGFADTFKALLESCLPAILDARDRAAAAKTQPLFAAPSPAARGSSRGRRPPPGCSRQTNITPTGATSAEDATVEEAQTTDLTDDDGGGGPAVYTGAETGRNMATTPEMRAAMDEILEHQTVRI